MVSIGFFGCESSRGWLLSDWGGRGEEGLLQLLAGARGAFCCFHGGRSFCVVTSHGVGGFAVLKVT